MKRPRTKYRCNKLALDTGEKKKRQKDNDKDVDKEDDKAEDELSEFDLVSHHLTRPSALAVISSLQVLLAVHTDTRER